MIWFSAFSMLFNSPLAKNVIYILTLQFYSLVTPKVASLNMNPKFLDRNVNEGFSGGEKKRNEILQLAVCIPTFLMYGI